MHSRRVVFVLVASLFAVAACATGTNPVGGGGTTETPGDDGGNSPLQSYGDGGGTGDTDATYVPKDSGSKIPIDSGSPPPDSGPPPTDNCVGETSSHAIPSSGGDNYYDDWCDYVSFLGAELDCTNNSDCTGNYKASYEPECCYKPVAGGYCEGDFAGRSQCVPK